MSKKMKFSVPTHTWSPRDPETHDPETHSGIAKLVLVLDEDEIDRVALEACATSAERSEIRMAGKKLDEVCGYGHFHLEEMDSGHWFLSLGDVAVWLSCKGKMAVSFERREKLTTPTTPTVAT